MKKYFAIYLAPLEEIKKMMETMTPESSKALMNAWGNWMKEHESSLVDGGSPLGKTKRVASAGITEAANEITGYSIVQAESHDAAAQMFVAHPHLQISGATIDVLEITELPQIEG